MSSARLHRVIENGTALIGSDAHVWPGPFTPAMRAFLQIALDTQPAIVVLNGDVFDGATISRFPSIGHEEKPTIIEELKACQKFLQDIVDVTPGVHHIWALGNHDMRFEIRVANDLPEYKGIQGFHLKDHFSEWEPCWSFWVNDDVCVKHRKTGGVHARYNNTLKAGVTMVTGHTHQLGVTPWTDYRGTRYGVETGTLAVPGGPQFINYTEDDSLNWNSGFVVLSWHDHRLLPPEIVYVDNEAETYTFRGHVCPIAA